MAIELKSTEELEAMRRAGRVVAEVLAQLREEMRPGITALDLDRRAEELTRARGAIPSFKGYRVGDRVFPASLCVSINDEIVHGIPSERVLREGDIVSLDFGAIVDGFHGDAAITIPVGAVSADAERLMNVTRESLIAGIRMVCSGNRIGDLSHEIQSIVESAGFSVVREFVGHGIGRRLHEEPQVPNYGPPGRGRRFREGMVLAIEPMVNLGGPEVSLQDDGWTAVTRDGSLSAHFEHSVAVTANGPEILTVA